MKSLLIAFFLFVPSFSFANNVLKTSTILSKMAENNGGKEAWIIKRTVTLKEESFSWQETWHIAHADLMRVDVSGKNADGSAWNFDIIYKNGKRSTFSTDGSLKTFPYSPEFYEPVLHYRSSKALASKLTAMQVLPTKWSEIAQDSYRTLDRHKGGTTLVFGSNETKSTQLPPRLWIDQDNFLIKKLRLGSQVEIDFDGLKEFNEGKTRIPETQTLFWKNSTVILQNTSAQMVSQSKIENQFKTQKTETAKMPDNVNLKEFYSRFR